jgi:hypothetical protein
MRVLFLLLDIQKIVDESEYPLVVVVLCRLVQRCFAERNLYPVHFGLVGIVGFFIVECFSLTL